MPPLPSDLRRVLENAVIAAREEATTAAGAALKRLAVEAKDFPPYLTPDERSLRLKLRAAARQLGDPWNADKQAFASLNKLTHEVAYEHWHRMLFARFLAENNLLIHPQHNVPVDLATVAELAQEEAAKTNVKADTWATAGRYAAAMLPQIFRPDDPALAVQLAPEHQQALEKVLESLPPQVFTADDSLGWVYQFWQSAEKDRVNDTVKAGAKITGETLPAVTQLFTEHYMVLFLLHNTIGAWHAGKVLATLEGQKSAAASTTEAELRDLVALPGYNFEYLRFVKDDASPAKWRPAAGTFPRWPTAAKELKVLDPCCGSGHFLVAALELLARQRIAEERLDPKAAALAVIGDNLFGLELDARCTQIAAFNVAFVAWKLAGEHFAVPDMHIACSGLGPAATLEQWLKLADKDSKAWSGIPIHARQSITNGLTNLHRLFSKAPELGSLIEPSQLGAGGELFSADWETLQPFIAAAMETEKDDDTYERAVAARGMAKAAEVLAGEYTLVITNVPYLGRGGQGDVLREFLETHHAMGKSDLSTAFVSRSVRWLTEGGSCALVTPQNWWFLASYSDLRRELIRREQWDLAVALGEEAWESFGIRGPRTVLLVLSRMAPSPDHEFSALDLTSQYGKPLVLRDEKIRRLASSTRGLSLDPRDGVFPISQRAQLDNPGGRIVLGDPQVGTRLGEYVDAGEGMSTGDNDQFVRRFWEVDARNPDWILYAGADGGSRHWHGRELVVRWEEGNGPLARSDQARVQGTNLWHGNGVLLGRIRGITAVRYTGGAFDKACVAVVPKNPADLRAIYAFLRSEEYEALVRELDQKVAASTSVLTSVSFDIARWREASTSLDSGACGDAYCDDPEQFLFVGHPAPSPGSASLQVAAARLVGYKWPAELDTKIRLAPEARAWVEKCKHLESHADDDGVVPLVNINKERPGHERVRAVLEAAFGPKWTPGLLNDLVAAAGSPGKSLDDWLRGGDFWAQHCAVFHHRPFVWQIWDGKKDGFNILVHYHRLAEGDGKGHKLLQKITYTYLGDWIAQQQAAAKRGEAGADLRLKAAQDLQKKLELIITGEPPYDIFVRWKPLHEQPIGWNPDINDGVRVNIRPFVTAGVLRGKVNVKWTKDRGKEPESIRPKKDFPWFWSCPEEEPPVDFAGGAKFTGERLNDLHYTRKGKEAARITRA